mgnify:CR=1 FL=1
MAKYTFDRFEITLYLTQNIRPTIEIPPLLEHGVEKVFKEKYEVDLGVLQNSTNAIDHDSIYVGQPEEQNIVIWKGYAVLPPADTRKFGFLGSRFRSKKRLAQKLNDVLMEALKNYYIDSKVTCE